MTEEQSLVPGIEGDTVMAQLQKLFEPPGKSQVAVDGVGDPGDLHPYFKRPGKGHNHDCCDSCGEGGALICCDFCPASFHLQCHDPPLEDLDIPDGDWMCIKCFTSKPENQKLIEKARLKPKSPVKVVQKPSNKDDKPGVAGVAPLVTKVDKEWKPGGKGKKLEISKPIRATRTLKKKMYADNSTEDEESEKEVETNEADKPVVPRGMYKDLYIEHIISKPTQTSSPFQTLLQAVSNVNAVEFELPEEINLPERFPYSWKWSTDEKRRKVEEESDKPIMCYVCGKTNRVGPLVTCDYCPLSFHLDCLDPPMSEIPRDVWMCPNHVESFLDTKLQTTSVTERVKLWDKYARQPIDTNAVKLQFMKRCQREKRNDKFTRRNVPVSLKNKIAVPNYVKNFYQNPAQLLPGPGNERWFRPEPRQPSDDRQNISDREMEWVSGLVSLQTDLLKKMTNSDQEDKDDAITADVKEEEDTDLKCNESLDTRSMSGDEEPVENVEELSQSVSPASTLSTCSLSPRHKNQLNSHVSQTHVSQSGNLVSMLTEYLAQHKSADSVKDMDPVVVQYLATRQLETLMGDTKTKYSDLSMVHSRASLTPLHSRKSPILMSYRTLNVGSDSSCGLNLSQYGHCNYISNKHASIFYDELSDCYELLNYSHHGTMVDEVLYSLDTAMVSARYPAKVKPETSESMMAANLIGDGQAECGCYCDGDQKSGCENSALLRHGSLIQFGCLQFVFSVAEMGRDVEL